MCKRSHGDLDPKTLAPTPVLSGYCPSGYIGLRETGTIKVLRFTFEFLFHDSRLIR